MTGLTLKISRGSEANGNQDFFLEIPLADDFQSTDLRIRLLKVLEMVFVVGFSQLHSLKNQVLE